MCYSDTAVQWAARPDQHRVVRTKTPSAYTSTSGGFDQLGFGTLMYAK
ncbi:hypothetical protein [Streptomyces sp. NPDC051572]